jgi:hypothetical protein
MKLMGVYFAVRILLRAKEASGLPSPSLASSGSGMLKKTLLPDSPVVESVSVL